MAGHDILKGELKLALVTHKKKKKQLGINLDLFINLPILKLSLHAKKWISFKDNKKKPKT